jgi:hypothetical protein
MWPHDVESFIFIGSSALNVSIYSENGRGIYFSPQKRLKHGRQNITLHWINGIIRNNKCMFTKLNAAFILKTAAWTQKYILLVWFCGIEIGTVEWKNPTWVTILVVGSNLFFIRKCKEDFCKLLAEIVLLFFNALLATD